MQSDLNDLKNAIRDVPDFPKKGIIFKDITTLLGNAERFRTVIDLLAERYKGKGIRKIVCIESRGFILGAALAYKIGAGIVPVRKKGKLPYKTIASTYKLEYGEDTLEMHSDALSAGEKVLVIDDLLATGGTASAAVQLVKQLGAEIAGITFLVELSFLEGRKNLGDYDVFALLQY